MKKVGVFFGGKSCEHEVSIITAVTTMAELENKYDIIPVYVCDKGWFTGELLKEVDSYKCFDEGLHTKVFLNGKALYKKVLFGIAKKISEIDVALVCMHGGMGEGGGLAGLFEINEIPYTSSGVLESAICLDKEYFKAIAKAKGYKVVPGITIRRDDFLEKKVDLNKIVKKFGKDLIVKPVDLGSSIGISAVHGEEELRNGLDIALSYAGRAIIEKKISPFTEYNCAACKVENEIIVSAIEKPERKGEILSYSDKYLSGGKKCVEDKNVDISYALANKIRKTTLKLYEDFNLSGVVRVDFIYCDEDGELYVNEVNTVPGSLSSNLFSKCGIEFEILADAIIDGAIFKFNKEGELLSRFSSELLSGAFKVSKS